MTQPFGYVDGVYWCRIPLICRFNRKYAEEMALNMQATLSRLGIESTATWTRSEVRVYVTKRARGAQDE